MLLKIQIIGNIGRDAEVRETNGKKAISFSVAVNKSYKNQQGVKVESTTWVNCTLWRDNTNIVPFLKAGTKVYVEGEPSARAYMSKQGPEPKASLELRVDDVRLLDSKKDNSTPAAAQTTEPAQAAPGNDDLPF